MFEDIRATLGKVLGCYTDIVCRAQNTMYGDTIEVYEASEHVPGVIAEVVKSVNTFNRVLDNLNVKQDVMLQYAQRGFSTATELAAVLFRETGLPLRVAHAIVGESVRDVWVQGKTALEITSEVVDRAAEKVVGKPLKLDADLLATALDAVHFVEAHRSQGAVAPKEVLRMTTVRRNQELKDAQERQEQRLRSLEQADEALEQAVKSILGPDADR